MEIQIKSIQDAVVDLEFAGVLTASLDRDVAQEICEQLGAEQLGIWIVGNMQGVRMVDSSGVNQLLRLRRLVREAGGQLALHSLQPAVGSIFEVLRLTALLNIAASREAALDRIINSP